MDAVSRTRRSTTRLTFACWRRNAGPPGFPRPTFVASPASRDSIAGSRGAVKDGRLEYYANTLVSYAVRGVHTKFNVIWDWEAPAGGGDTHFAFYRGTRARVEVRQTAADRYLPELYVVPT